MPLLEFFVLLSIRFVFFFANQSVDHGRGCFSAGFEIGTAKDRREMRQWKLDG
jgi:hypothetical protein